MVIYRKPVIKDAKLFIFMDPFPLSYENTLAGTVYHDVDTVSFIRCPEIMTPTSLSGTGTTYL